jgi:spore maturation protein SpmA
MVENYGDLSEPFLTKLLEDLGFDRNAMGTLFIRSLPNPLTRLGRFSQS